MANKIVSYKFLGNSGLKVSNICLGTMTFGDRKDGLKQCGEDEAHSLMDRFAELGGNFIDTADMYSGGLSEQYVGSWLSKRDRDEFVISTKFFCPPNPTDDVNGVGLSRKYIIRAIDASLKRLQTDYIDIYQIHRFDEGTPLEETFSTLNDLVRQGKVRYIGLSNVTGWQLQKIVDLCKSRGWGDMVALQQHYSILGRFSELSEFQVCKNEGIGVLPWSPLRGGLLSGKYSPGMIGNLPEGRISWAETKNFSDPGEDAPRLSSLNTDTARKVLKVMNRVAVNYGKTTAQVAIRWLLQKEVVTSVIIGTKTISQLEENMEAASGWSINDEEMNELDAASSFEVPYPYNMHIRENKLYNRYH